MILRIVQESVIDGPNLWLDRPVMRLVVESIDDNERAIRRCILLRRRIEQLSAGLDRARFVPLPIPPAPEPMTPPALLAWAALSLQRLAGDDCSFFETRPLDGARQSEIAFECTHRQTATLALRLALHQLNAAADGTAAADALERALTQRLMPVAASRRPDPTSACILAAARARGIPVTTIDPKGAIYELGYGCHRKRVDFTITSLTSAIGEGIARNKQLALHFLAECGLPVAETLVARDGERAVAQARTLGYPVVLKPIDSGDSAGLTVDVRDDEEVHAAFDHAVRESPSRTVVVQRYLQGGDYRVLVIGGKIVSAIQRKPARVTGDGRHSVRELVEIENGNPRRGRLASDRLKMIAPDEGSMRLLDKQGIDLDDVPEAGREVRLKGIDDLEGGSETVELTDSVHPDNAALLIAAARMLELGVAGIDVMAEDISTSIWETWGAILEVNCGTGFSSHQFPTSGRDIDPGPAVIEMLFPPGAPARIPLVAVTGGKERRAVAQSIGRMLQAAGLATGIATSDGLFLGGTRLGGIDGSGPRGSRRILLNPAVEAAVVEIPPQEIVDEGLAFERCDVAVVMSLSGASPAGLPEAESVVCRTVTPEGTIVVPADDPAALAFARQFDRRVVRFAIERAASIRIDWDGGETCSVEAPGVHGNERREVAAAIATMVALGYPVAELSGWPAEAWSGHRNA